jgi:hypothetical protein
MSDSDANEGEMTDLSHLSDRELDQLVSGRSPTAAGDLDGVAAVLDEARDLYRTEPGPTTEARHLAAMHEAARRLAESHSAATLATALRSEADPGSSWIRRRKVALRTPAAVLTAKVALAVALVLGAFGGTAYA